MEKIKKRFINKQLPHNFLAEENYLSSLLISTEAIEIYVTKN